MDKNCADNVRVDKWLWAIRVYKTRSLASDACKSKRVTINGVAIKPSRVLKIGEIIEVKRPPIIRHFKVKALLANRVSAKLVLDYMEDITPIEEIEQLRLIRYASNGYRDPGAGRPTKKERRTLDDFNYLDDLDDNDQDDSFFVN